MDRGEWEEGSGMRGVKRGEWEEGRENGGEGRGERLDAGRF